eukprot:TRINITY_DN64840_c0_g1_i1.p1 TRINITY_DN64840_c0_g1~~TRINITY_DN64840_c0_g1_i1.p1  ORF type:complete len:240 (+),score=65.84 TRINITY_DN64840_c0_g1_i1:72-722(+)
MASTGTVKSFNPHKGWGFIDCNGQDVFLNKKELKGFCVEKGTQVQFTSTTTEKGASAADVTVVISPEDATYLGEVKSFNDAKGFGFITCDAFPGQDVFVLRSDLTSGFAPAGGHCKFKVQMGDKGANAKEVSLLGAAGNQVHMMKMMGGMGKGMGKGMMGMMGMGGPMGVWNPMFMKQGKGSGKGSTDMTCWDLQKKGTCPRGASCKFKPCCDNNK